MSPPPPVLPTKIWAHILFLLPPTGGDLTAFSLASKEWNLVSRRARRHLVVGNCYAISPSAAVSRFEDITSVTIKGKPHFADFNLVPEGWGGGADAWVRAMADAWPNLEEIRLKRMVVSDEVLEIMSTLFENLKVIVMESCEGISTTGLAKIAANCRHLRELDLRENELDDTCPNWLSHFSESFTSLETLKIACLEGELNVSDLKSLVSRCPNLKSLRLNQDVALDELASLLFMAPQLVDLGTSRLAADPQSERYDKLHSAFAACKGLSSLSGIWDAAPSYLPTVYSVCDGLTFVNFSYATLQSSDITEIVSQCKNLRRLWVLDLIEDTGLEAVASSCKLLEELRVFPSDPFGTSQPVPLTERGLVTISANCPMLRSILYFCHQMTNDALTSVAKNSPNLIHFRLCIIEPHTPDYLTQQPLDTGFSAIVEHCKDLQRLSLSGLLTDLMFKSIGAHANRLKMLSMAFAGDSDAGLRYILSGCKSLRKLEIRDCPFGDGALLENAEKLETMRSLWLSSCGLSLGACRELGRRMPRLNVEVMDETVEGEWDSLPDSFPVDKLYVYRSVAGRRTDMPPCVCAL